MQELRLFSVLVVLSSLVLSLKDVFIHAFQENYGVSMKNRRTSVESVASNVDNMSALQPIVLV